MQCSLVTLVMTPRLLRRLLHAFRDREPVSLCCSQAKIAPLLGPRGQAQPERPSPMPPWRCPGARLLPRSPTCGAPGSSTRIVTTRQPCHGLQPVPFSTCILSPQARELLPMQHAEVLSQCPEHDLPHWTGFRASKDPRSGTTSSLSSGPQPQTCRDPMHHGC